LGPAAAMPCARCSLGCELRDELSFIWQNSCPPVSGDTEYAQLLKTLVSSLSQLVRDHQIVTPGDLGVALAALFDLCVSLEYDKLVADTDWVYCPASKQHREPVLVYPYVNACPRCAASGHVAPVRSHKPGSATIGRIAAKTLGAMLSALSQTTRSGWEVRQATQKVLHFDILLFDVETLALCEVKASPLVAFPLLAPLEQELQRPGHEDRREPITQHRKTDLPLAKAGEVSLYVPHTEQRYSLGKPTDDGYPIREFTSRYAGNTGAILDIINAWRQLFAGYNRKWQHEDDNRIRWLTFGCGGKVDDSKNSPGIDRTDDIKKGVYQMLKLGEHFGARCKKGAIKVVLLANIHAVRHHGDYLSGLEDMTWTRDRSLVVMDDPNWRKVRVEDLIRLYDAAVAFTMPHFRDARLAAGFGLDGLLRRLGGSEHAKA